MSRAAYEYQTIKDYIKYKTKILKQMQIRLTDAQLKHLKSLKRHVDIDNYCHDLMMNS